MTTHTNKPIVHQIWVGKPIPKFIANLCNTISQGCTSAGWEYKLWDWPMLKEHFADDPLTPELDYLMKISPIGHTYGLVSDYYRLALMAELHGRGTLYLDTDFILVGEEWPEFPCEADLYYIHGAITPDLVMNGIFFLPPEKSVTPFVIAHQLTATNIKNKVLPKLDIIKNSPHKLYNNRAVIKLTGPEFITSTVVKEWDKLHIQKQLLPKNIFAYHCWLYPASLCTAPLCSWDTYK